MSTAVVSAPRPRRARESPLAVLSARGLVKRFGPVLALDRADFELRPGIHALLGENGAGKSTLVKAIYGYCRPDEGEIYIDGKHVDIGSPADARRLGIGLVFQQFTLIPALTVAENVALFLPDLKAVLHHEQIAARIREMSTRYGLSVDPSRRVGTLSLPEQQRVEIVRVLLAGAKILIFDEPTSALPAQEIDALFAVFRRLREDGYPIVFITHKLPEVLALADTVTVMRRGAVVDTLDIAEVDEDRLVELMFGAAPAPVQCVRAEEEKEKKQLLALEGVSSVGRGRPLFDLDVSIASGEIVGVAGIAGNGQRELADTVVGLSKIKRGRRVLLGRDATRWSVRQLRESGIGFIPESALGQELIWNMTLEENIALGSPKRFSRRGGLGVDWHAVRDDWREAFDTLDLHLPDPRTRAGTLSGGNAQRFAVARELARKPRILVALYVTRGLDVPTTAAVQELLLTARDRGCGILLVSQDLGELRKLSDRLLVMRDARVVAEVDPDRADAYELGRLMTGGDEQ